jgi:hypothetical protein
MSENINVTNKKLAPKKKLVPTRDHAWLGAVVGGYVVDGGGDGGVGADGCAGDDGGCGAADGGDGGDGG